LANHIAQLASNGMHIINDDIGYGGEPWFQDGVIAVAINNFVDGGGVYFGSAGNNALDFTYQHAFVDTNGNGWHEFAPGDETLRLLVENDKNAYCDMQWTQPWGGAATNMQIGFFVNGSLVAESLEDNIGGNPNDVLSWKNTTGGDAFVDVIIRRASGASAAGLTLKTIFGAKSMEEYHGASPGGSIVAHVGGSKGIAIGEIPYTDPDNANRTTTYGSCPGPHTHFFNPSGTPYPTPIVYQKPDFMGIDCVNTSFFGGDQEGDGFPNFCGTSAAGPNVAAVAALLQDLAGTGGSLSSTRIHEILRLSAVDLKTPGHDRWFGWGRVHAVGAAMLTKGPDPYEFNLYPNHMGDAVYEGDFYSASDIDIFRAAFRSGTSVDVTVQSLDGLSDPMLGVFKEATNDFVALDYDSGAGDTASLSFFSAAQVPHRYQVLTEIPLSGANAEYRLTLNGSSQYTQDVELDAIGYAGVSGTLGSNFHINYYRVNTAHFGNYNGRLSLGLTPVGFQGMLIVFDNATGSLLGQEYGSGVGTNVTYAVENTQAATLVIAVLSSEYSGKGTYQMSAMLTSYTPTPTQTRTPTRTGTPTRTPTFTPTHTSTPTFSPVATQTNTQRFTQTPTATRSTWQTPTSTWTPLLKPTRTDTPTATPTNEQEPTATDSPTPTASATPSLTPVDTETPSPTPTASATPSLTPVDTETPSPTLTASATPSVTPVDTETPSPTPTPSATPSVTPVDTETPSPTLTASATPSVTPVDTETPSPTPTASATPSVTPVDTETPSPTPTASATPSLTPVDTGTPSPTPTQQSTPMYRSADFDGDRDVDRDDLIKILQLRNRTGDLPTDLNGDGVTDAFDILLFSRQWDPPGQ